jgi:hypothetical protein
MHDSKERLEEVEKALGEARDSFLEGDKLKGSFSLGLAVGLRNARFDRPRGMMSSQEKEVYDRLERRFSGMAEKYLK